MDNKSDLAVLYDEICRNLKKNNVAVDSLKKISYGIQFKMNINGSPETMRIYQNGKGVIKYDYSQIKRREYLGMVKKIIEEDSLPGYFLKEKKVSIQSNFNKFSDAGGKAGNIASSDSFQNAGCSTKRVNKTGDRGIYDLGYPVIGTDESGKGDYFGPLITAGVLLDENSAVMLKSLGVRDSKDMSDSEIKFTAGKIRDVCKGRYAVVEICPERYNELYRKFVSDGENLNNMLAWCHAEVIEEILSGNKCETVLVDKFADDSVLFGKLRDKGRDINVVQLNRAEQNIAVAAASVLARSVFVEDMDRLSEKYSIRLPKGASAAVIRAGKKFVDEYGRSELKNVAKVHFKTTGQIIS